jgi:hypothetical protein
MDKRTTVGIDLAKECQGSPNFPQCGRSNFPTRLRRVVVV